MTSKEINDNDLMQLEAEYRSILPTAKSLSEELPKQLYKMLEKENLALGVPIECRVKDWIKIPEKLERNSLKINHIIELQDLVGARLIFLFKRDVPKVRELIEVNFKKVKMYDTQERLQDDQFGYTSIHYVVELNESWLKVPIFSQMKDLKVEIQVRTVAQHIWAAASHILQYKKETSVPPPIRRAIYRVSALLEIVDLEFDRVLEQREEYRTGIDVSDATETLNVDILEKLLDSLLPPANKDSAETYSDLLTDLLHFKVDTISTLNELIAKHYSEILKMDNKLVDEYRNFIGKLKMAPIHLRIRPERIERGVFFTHAGLVRSALRLEFGDEWKKYQSQKLPHLHDDSL